MNEDIHTLLDIYRSDPSTAIAMAREAGLLSDLFNTHMDNLQQSASEIRWRHLTIMAQNLESGSRAQAFNLLVLLAQQVGQQLDLLTELVKSRKDTMVIDMHATSCTPLFLQVKKAELATIAEWPFAFNTWFMDQLSRFIKSGDNKRAFDTMVEAARMLCRAQGPLTKAFPEPFIPQELGPRETSSAYGRRMREIASNPMLATYIDMVWNAHRKAGLVHELDDAGAWENTAQHISFSYGQNCRGTKPQIFEHTGSLPMAWLWGAYADIGEISGWTCPVDRAEYGGSGWGSGKEWFPVRSPGNKLRLLIRYQHGLAKRRKLESFCRKHGLEAPE